MADSEHDKVAGESDTKDTSELPTAILTEHDAEELRKYTEALRDSWR